MDDRFVKKCRVCGDKALSFNFEGLCCESCKIFFRRNAFKLKEYKCYQKGNCPIDIGSRKTCQFCRLNKCFAIGMRKELIVTKGKPNDELSEEARQLIGKSVLLIELLTEDRDENEVANQFNLNKVEIKSEIKEEHLSDQDNEVKQEEHQLDQSSSTLQQYELHCLEVIKKVTLIFQGDEPRDQVNVIGYANDLVQVFNTQELHLQNMIAFSNTIAGFKSLSHHDQLIVFKTAFPEILLLRSAYFFNLDKNAFLVRVSQIFFSEALVRLDTLYGPDEDIIKQHRQLAYKVRDVIENDIILRDLIFVLLMFKPKDNLSNPEYMRYQFCSYCHLLRKYLQFKYQNSRKTTEKYFKLKQIVQDIGQMRPAAMNVISSKLDPNKVSDVLAEIYYLREPTSSLMSSYQQAVPALSDK